MRNLLYTRTSDELVRNKSSPLSHAQFPVVALRVPSIPRLSMVKLVSVCEPNHTQKANMNEIHIIQIKSCVYLVEESSI